MQPQSAFAVSTTETVFSYYASGDESLLRQLFLDLRPILLDYACTKLNVQDEQQREDIVQDTFSSMLGSLRRQQFTGAVSTNGQRIGLLTWARNVCRNRFLDRLEWDSRRPGAAGAEEDPFRVLAQQPAEEETPDLSGLVPQAEAMLRAATEAVLDLEPKLRQPLIAVYFQGMTPQQAAAQLGLRPATVRARLAAGLLQLREWGQRQPLRPNQEVYQALRHLDTGDLFTEPMTLRMAG